MVNESLLNILKDELEKRRTELRAQLDRGLADAGRNNLRELSGGIGDAGDEAVAELAASGRLAVLQFDTEELADTEAALERIREGVFGACIACGEEIAEERLRVYPTAKRCLRCQEEHEQQGRSPTDLTPSL